MIAYATDLKYAVHIQRKPMWMETRPVNILDITCLYDQ